MAPKPRDALKEHGGVRGCRQLSAMSPGNRKTCSCVKRLEQFSARAIPCCAEPGPGAALHRPPLKIKTDLPFRGFCIQAGRMRIFWYMERINSFSTPKTRRKALVWVTSSIHSSNGVGWYRVITRSQLSLVAWSCIYCTLPPSATFSLALALMILLLAWLLFVFTVPLSVSSLSVLRWAG